MAKLTKQQAKYTEDTGILSAYRQLVVGSASWTFLLYFEVTNLLLANLRGILGLGLRSLVYPSFFRSCGRRLAVGSACVFRGTKQIVFGNKVILDDQVVVDARGDSAEISLANHVTIGRSTLLIAKNAKIHLAEAVNVSSFCRIASETSITIGQNTLIAAYAYIGPGDHQIDPEGGVQVDQPMIKKGGVVIGKNCWIGTKATIMDGVVIGDNVTVGAHAFVKDDLPEGSVAVGSPARIIKNNND